MLIIITCFHNKDDDLWFVYLIDFKFAFNKAFLPINMYIVTCREKMFIKQKLVEL
jgi:hypothetical protein